MARPEARDTHAKVWVLDLGYTDSFPVPSTLSQLCITGDLSTCEHLHTFKSQFKVSYSQTLLGTVPLPFLGLLAHENFL